MYLDVIIFLLHKIEADINKCVDEWVGWEIYIYFLFRLDDGFLKGILSFYILNPNNILQLSSCKRCKLIDGQI